MKYKCVCRDCKETLQTDHDKIKEAWERVHRDKLAHVVVVLRKKEESDA